MLHEKLCITVDLRQVDRESASGDTETDFEQRRSGTFWEMYMNPALGNSSIFICVIDQLSTRSCGLFDSLIYNITKKKRKIAKVNNSLNACGLPFFYIGNNLRTWAPVKCLFCKLNKIDFLNYIATRFLSRIVSTLVHQEVKFFEVIEPSSWTTSNFACDWLRLCHCFMIFQEIFLICMTRAQNDVTRKNLGLIQLTILPRLVWSVSPCLVKPTPSNASLNSSPRAKCRVRLAWLIKRLICRLNCCSLELVIDLTTSPKANIKFKHFWFPGRG